jgi:hypothetical protein
MLMGLLSISISRSWWERRNRERETLIGIKIFFEREKTKGISRKDVILYMERRFYEGTSCWVG